jgi:hypothetical protein
MTGGCQCGAYALTGKPFCYFHSRLHRDARKPVSLIDSIDIPRQVSQLISQGG